MPETRPYIPWDVITNFMKDAFMGYGVPERDAEICTDVLVESDRRGIESHGCNRFKPSQKLKCCAKRPQRLFMMLITAWAWLRATA